MIELKINDGSNITELIVTKNNNILYKDSFKLLQFYELFYDVINNSNSIKAVEIDGKAVNSKNFILINLLDYDSFLQNFKFKKGTILYQYINNIIANSDDKIEDDINEYLENKYTTIFKDIQLPLKTEINTNLFKLINTTVEIQMDFDFQNSKDYLNIMIKNLFEYNIDKHFIIFFDSNYIDINLNDYDNIYTFNINKNSKIKEYNIFLLDDFLNFNYEVFVNLIKTEWPLDYDEMTIHRNINCYFQNCLNRSCFMTDNINLAILTKIINKLYNFKQNVSLSIPVDNNIKSFLIS